jgi:hypothetical protein
LKVILVNLVQNLLSRLEREDTVGLFTQKSCVPIHLRRIFVGTFKDSMSGGSVTKIAKIVKKVLVTDWSISGEFEAGSESRGGLLFDLFVAVKLLITRVTLHPDASRRTSTTISSSNHTLERIEVDGHRYVGP